MIGLYIIAVFVVIALAVPFLDYVYWYHLKKPIHTIDEVEEELKEVQKKIAEEQDYYELEFLFNKQDMLNEEKRHIIRYNKKVNKS